LISRRPLKELFPHIGGYRLRNRFWENLAPAGKGGRGAPKGDLAKAIDREFGKFGRFKKGVYPDRNQCRGFRLDCRNLL
jgi:superoxide dismutase